MSPTVWDSRSYDSMEIYRHSLQATIRKKSSEATYILCFAHSLNLADNETAGCTSGVRELFPSVDVM